MLIAITSSGSTLESTVDERFGRCPYFLIINTDNLDFEAVANSNAMLSGGAGIQSAQMLAGKGVTHVLTGACGPNAYQTLSAAGIHVITGCAGTVRDVIRQFQEGKFAAIDGPTVASHFGVGGSYAGQSSAGMGGASGGRGMGMGGGRGMGMGGGMGTGFRYQTPADSLSPEGNSENELELLKKQMQQINERIKELEKKGIGKEKK